MNISMARLLLEREATRKQNNYEILTSLGRLAGCWGWQTQEHAERMLSLAEPEGHGLTWLTGTLSSILQADFLCHS